AAERPCAPLLGRSRPEGPRRGASDSRDKRSGRGRHKRRSAGYENEKDRRRARIFQAASAQRQRVVTPPRQSDLGGENERVEKRPRPGDAAKQLNDKIIDAERNDRAKPGPGGERDGDAGARHPDVRRVCRPEQAQMKQDETDDDQQELPNAQGFQYAVSSGSVRHVILKGQPAAGEILLIARTERGVGQLRRS